MEVTKLKKQCQPFTSPPRFHSTPNKNHFFYSEKTPPPEATPRKQKSRPSSANSARSSHKGSDKSPKLRSSDSKIHKKSVVVRTRIKKKPGAQLDPTSVNQLKEDLKIIKEQLVLLTKKKTVSLKSPSQSDCTYDDLVNKSHEQEVAIEELKDKNHKLLDRWKEARNVEGINMKDVVSTKLCLDRYEEKLNMLYGEFLDTSKVMQESRKSFCRCIKDSREADKSKDLSKCVSLIRLYEDSQQNEHKYKKQNEKLIQTIGDLESQLQQMMMELELSRTEAMLNATRLQDTINENSKSYSHDFKQKTREISELKSTVQELQSTLCACKNKSTTNTEQLQNEYNEVVVKYKKVVETLNSYEKNMRKRVEEIQALKNNEKELIAKFGKLQKFLQELAALNDRNNLTIAELTSSNKEKDSLIQCQKIHLASKDKQLELMCKNEERLRKRMIQVQEDLVSVRVCSCQEKENIASAQEDSHLSDELQDLISVLYEEIDKAINKDEEIEKQKRKICCLQCALSAKEKEVLCLRKELKILRDQFYTAVREKEKLSHQLEKVESTETCECGCDDDDYP